MISIKLKYNELSINNMEMFEQQFQREVFESSTCLKEALKSIDLIVDSNMHDEYDPIKYYYEEVDNEFHEYRVIGVFFMEDPFWDHVFDKVLFNKCWHLAKQEYFMDVLDYHIDMYQIMRLCLPVFMRIYIFKSFKEWILATSGSHEITGSHILYDCSKFINHILPNQNKDFKRHVLCHYIYFFYKKYYYFEFE